MKDKIFGVLQRVGRSFMLPIAILPVAGLLLGFGGSFTNETMLETYGLLNVMGPGTIPYAIFQVMSEAGNIVFANLPIIFAMGVAIGMAKKEKEAKKNQKVVEVKEIRMSPSIDTNDFNTKVKNAQKFLKDGNRVKVTVRFRGREMAHTSLGEELLKQFGADCDEIATVAKGAKLEGRNMSMFLSPKNSK